MTTFEYLTVLISVIVGLGITHLLGGVARFISNPRRYKLYWTHLVWTGYVFLYLITFWWGELQLRSVENWTILLYCFMVLHAVILFLVCAVIIPSDFPEDGDFRAYYYERRRWFFGMIIVATLVGVADLLSRGLTPNPVFIALYLALLATGMVTKNAKYHGVFALLNLLCGVATLVGEGWDQFVQR